MCAYLSDFLSLGQHLEDSGQGSWLPYHVGLGRTGMSLGVVGVAGRSLRTKQSSSPRSVGPDHGLKKQPPINHPKWAVAISPWKNLEQPLHNRDLWGCKGSLVGLRQHQLFPHFEDP